jgi:glycosyltransferase involved in cell wall biosynthesis
VIGNTILKARNRLFFFTRYGAISASTRYRFCQFIPALQQQGYECHVYALFDDEFQRKKIIEGTFSYCRIAVAIVRTIIKIALLQKTDLIIIHKEIFPFIPPIFEWLLSKTNRKIIYDFDDAIFITYENHRFGIIRLLLKNKIRCIIRNARGVIAGNKYLSDYARNDNDFVTILPTVVDLNRYSFIKKVKNNDNFTVGWIGSPSTSEYLKAIEPVFQEFFRTRKGLLYIIGAAINYHPAGVPLLTNNWNEENEIEQLLKFDVGVMPLPNIPWAWGKCGFKIIQYFACGLPAIASPVGMNNEIIIDGTNGFLPHTYDAWLDALTKIYDSPKLRERMGAMGRKLVEERYSLQCMTKPYIKFINDCKKK